MKLFRTEDLDLSEYSLTFNDISLVPGEISTLNHRSEASTAVNFLGLALKVPIISSPMESVTGMDMCKKLAELGCLGILNRFGSELDGEDFRKVQSLQALSIGVNEVYFLENLSKFIKNNNLIPPIICLDTANASNKLVINTAKEIKYTFPEIKLIIGNIAYTNYNQGFELLIELDKYTDAVRVGIGNGSVCSTSVRTGVGVGQVSSLANLLTIKNAANLNIKIIADGGLSTPGDVCKALALGADAVMLGRMLSGTKEAPGEVIKFNGALYKKYRGSASYGVKKNGKYVEGEETLVEYKGSVEDVINSIIDGLQSSMAYLNAKNLDDFKFKARFTLLSHSSYMERLAKL